MTETFASILPFALLGLLALVGAWGALTLWLGRNVSPLLDRLRDLAVAGRCTEAAALDAYIARVQDWAYHWPLRGFRAPR